MSIAIRALNVENEHLSPEVLVFPGYARTAPSVVFLEAELSKSRPSWTCSMNMHRKGQLNVLRKAIRRKFR